MIGSIGARTSVYVAGRTLARARVLRSLDLIPFRDPLAATVESGDGVIGGARRPTLEVRWHCRALRDRARAEGQPLSAMPDLLEVIREYPRVEEFQKIAARLIGESGAEEEALRAWLGISVRFPRSMEAFHNLAVLVHRKGGAEAAEMLLRARFPRFPVHVDQLLVYAEVCDLVGDTEARRAAFERLARLFNLRSERWMWTSSWLEEELALSRKLVGVVRRFAAGAGLAPLIIRDRQRLQATIGDWDADPATGRQNLPSVKVFGAHFARLIEERNADRGGRLPGQGPAFLLTGSLGAGGAERQLVTTAVGLQGMEGERRRLRDGVLLDSIGVVARSLRDRKDGAFFEGELKAAGVSLSAYRDLPDFGGDLQTSAVRPALSALGYLPWSTSEAVIKLTDLLRQQRPQIVHIWQDGLVYAAGLAALLAGVPRIVLSGRSTPPPDRRERYLVEYDVIYRSLLQAPGVKLSVNSRFAAQRYASWLKIDPEEISIIPNGVAPLPPEGDAAARARWQAFDARTAKSTLTLGAVMRLDEVKRPLLWIDAAASVLQRVPGARFVVVGDGPFRGRVERRAEALGVASRCLFVGRSNTVGYWLTKMNALMLLSEHEGLPNALIEAQLAGVPVVATAVGGVPEAFLPGQTGLLLGRHPDSRQIGDIVKGLAAQPDRLREMGRQAAIWARAEFPIDRMIGNTLELYSAAGQGLRLAAAPEPHPAPLTAGPQLRYTG